MIKRRLPLLEQTSNSAYFIFDDANNNLLNDIDKHTGLGVAQISDTLVRLGKLENIDGKTID